jgi:SAM-dependent methyltransferase
MYWNDLERHTGGRQMEEIWLASPAVREAVNLRITGDPCKWPLDWFREAFTKRLPLTDALSIGCGAGALERDLVAKGICQRVTGIDVAGPPLEKARQEATAAGLEGQVSYLQEDARVFLRRRSADLDAVFFHESLHHFDRVYELLRLVESALEPGGLLYVDEYVGPSRRQWNPLRLALPNLAYYTLPRSVRRVGLIRAPINREDPTEAIASHEIVPAIGRCLKVLERKDYGGNFLSLVYPNLRRPGEASGPEAVTQFGRAIQRLLGWEDRVLGKARTYYTVIVATKEG